MKRQKNDNKNTLLWMATIVLAILVSAGVVVAQSDVGQKIFNIAGDYIEAPASFPTDTDGGDQFGGVTMEIEYLNEGWGIDGRMHVDGDGLAYYRINEDLLFDGNATTSNEVDYVTTGYWQNPNSDKDLVIEDFYLDVTETFAFEHSMECGTTTAQAITNGWPYRQWSATTTAQTIVASTTISTTWDSKDPDTGGFFGVDSYPGTAFNIVDKTGHASTSKFVLEEDEYIICTWNPYSATSTAS